PSAEAAVFQQHFDQAFFAEFFPFWAAGFCHSIREKHELVTGGKLNLAPFIVPIGEQSQRRAALAKAEPRTISPRQNRRIVPRIRKDQPVTRAVEQAIKSSDEFAQRN